MISGRYTYRGRAACPYFGQNDRVRCQACFQAVPVRSMALSVTTSLRTHAVSATLEAV